MRNSACQVWRWVSTRPGSHEAVGRVDHLRVLDALELGRDADDPAVLDQDIAAREVADLRIDGDDRPALD